MKRVQARHAEQTSDAIGGAPSQGGSVWSAIESQSPVQREARKARCSPVATCVITEGGWRDHQHDLCSCDVVNTKRVLVDWEWGGDGLSLVLSSEELEAQPPVGARWRPYKPTDVQSRAWSGELSEELLDDLQLWNDEMGVASASDPNLAEALRTRVRPLAERVQEELGSEWEVLYESDGVWLPIRQH